jgi:hypothetical protein
MLPANIRLPSLLAWRLGERRNSHSYNPCVRKADEIGRAGQKIPLNFSKTARSILAPVCIERSIKQLFNNQAMTK